jgi:hypothetical protein
LLLLFAEINGAVPWVMSRRMLGVLPMLVCLSDAALGPFAYADCDSTAQAAIAVRNWPLRQELLSKKISTMELFMMRAKG